jgi:hypothetical protein
VPGTGAFVRLLVNKSAAEKRTHRDIALIAATLANGRDLHIN